MISPTIIKWEVFLWFFVGVSWILYSLRSHFSFYIIINSTLVLTRWLNLHGILIKHLVDTRIPDLNIVSLEFGGVLQVVRKTGKTFLAFSGYFILWRMLSAPAHFSERVAAHVFGGKIILTQV